MRLLLDTHAALWWLAGDERFGQTAERLLADPENEVLLSAVVVWEIAVKRALGKLTAPADVAERLFAGGASGLSISLQHAAAAGGLPDLHRDPFDRLLIVQAQIEQAMLLTKDLRIGQYDVTTAW